MKNFFYLSILMIFLNIAISAQPGLEPDTIFVSSGWNLIGSKFTGAVSEIVSTEPPDIISSPFYKYSLQGGYSASDTLEKSNGYWVKVSDSEGAGSIIVSPPSRPFICGQILRGRVWYGDRYYHSVQIGSQCWLRKNLNIGTMIDGDDGGVHQTDNDVLEKYCYYDDEANCEAYGGLYQWNEAMQYVTTPGTQGICPNGWHIPTLAEFDILGDYVDGESNNLKAVGQGSGAGAGTNSSGFSALLAGYYRATGTEYLGFHWLTFRAWFWNSSGLIAMDLNNYENNVGYFFGFSADHGLSVRCIKD